MDRKKKLAIIGGISLAVIIAFVTAVVPRIQAKRAVAEYNEVFDLRIDTGYYQEAVDSANVILEKYDGLLEDEDIKVLRSRIAYANAIEILNLTHKVPQNRVDISSAREYLEQAEGYGISKDLIDFIDEKGNEYDDNLTGTLTVDHSKYDENKDNSDLNVDGTSIHTKNIVSFERGGLNSKKNLTLSQTTVTGKLKIPRDNVPSNNNNDEEKPKKNEYTCDGFITFGFREKDGSKGIKKENVEEVVVVHASLSDTPEENVCTSFDAVFDAEKPDDIVIECEGTTPVEVKASYEDGTIKASINKGVTLELEKRVGPSIGYSNNGSSSSSGSSNNKDYSPGSEWEQYDTDKDGRISDEEFQNATGDYMDKYYDNNSSNNKDYSSGSEWENYDSDKDGKITDKEFQNATGDYIDKYFEEHGTGGDLNAYDYNGNQEMENNEFQDAVGDYMDQHGY